MSDHQCSPHDLDYGDTSVRCEVCGRTWTRVNDRHGRFVRWHIHPLPPKRRRKKEGAA